MKRIAAERPPLPALPLEGGCHCGRARYRVTTRPLAVNACHCGDCKRLAGGPFGLYLHGNEGTEGAERAVDGITAGLGWIKAARYVVVSGKPAKTDLEACWNLGATLAAQLMG